MGPLAGGDRLGAARLVMRRQLIDPRMDAAERQIVRRQHQRVGRQRGTEFPERAQITRERIALGLVRRHADIGRDLRQDLVAGNQNAGLGAIKRGELRRMSFADNDPPLPPAYVDLAPLTDPVIGRRHRGHAAPVAGMAHGKDVARLVVEAGPLGKSARRLRIISGAVAGHHARVQPLLLGDPQGRLPTLGEPAGKPDMVGMVMRDDDPPHRPAAEIAGKELLPQRGRLSPGKAAIDDRPARPVFQEPQIDVVERKGQRHAQPQNAGGDQVRLARRRRRRDRKFQHFSHAFRKLGGISN